MKFNLDTDLPSNSYYNGGRTVFLELEKHEEHLLHSVRSDDLANGAIIRIDDMLDKSNDNMLDREEISHLYMGAFRSALSIYCLDKTINIPDIARTTRSVGNYLADTYLGARK